MRRFRREGVHHYGAAGAQRLHAQRRTSQLALGRTELQDATDNSRPTESVPTDSGGALEREDSEAPEG